MAPDDGAMTMMRRGKWSTVIDLGQNEGHPVSTDGSAIDIGTAPLLG